MNRIFRFHGKMKHPLQFITGTRNGEYLFASVMNHIQVFNLKTGHMIFSWTDDVDNDIALKKEQEKKIKALQEQDQIVSDNSNKKAKSDAHTTIKVPKIPTLGPGAPPTFNYIRTLRLSRNEKFLIASTDNDKSIVIFEIHYDNPDTFLSLVKRQVTPKRPCATTTTIDDEAVIVADKFGDVFSIEIDEKAKSDGELEPILGHVSMLSDVEVAKHGDKHFILTGDRDEHIRISNYPKSYVIKNFLFGHKEFVSSLHVPYFNEKILITGGGDDFICVWDWYEGILLSKTDLRPVLEPYLNSQHYPPPKFLTETSIPEISISKILSFYNEANDQNLVFILCEQTKCILEFQLNEDYTLKYLRTLELRSNSISSYLIPSEGIIVISNDDELHDDLVLFIKIASTSLLELMDKRNIVQNISNESVAEVDSRKDLFPLYTVHTLRKRSEY